MLEHVVPQNGKKRFKLIPNEMSFMKEDLLVGGENAAGSGNLITHHILISGGDIQDIGQNWNKESGVLVA